MINKKHKDKAVKNDQNKLRLDLTPAIAQFIEAHVYTVGIDKYAEHNWRRGMKWSRILRALKSHLAWFEAGEDLDPEDGQYHLGSVIWCAKTLLEYKFTHPDLDDRYIPLPPTELRQIVKELESKSKGKTNGREREVCNSTKE
jgi:dATP/dGTP diphosphohydrolase